jgi:hypothetical protein
MSSTTTMKFTMRDWYLSSLKEDKSSSPIKGTVQVGTGIRVIIIGAGASGPTPFSPKLIFTQYHVYNLLISFRSFIATYFFPHTLIVVPP